MHSPTSIKNMRASAIASLMLALAMQAGSATGQDASAGPPETVRSLDVARYMGTWYEIARYPNRFQRKCIGNTTATYTARPDGQIDVVNRCKREDGASEVATGLARQLGGADSPKLEVRFAPAFLSFLPMVWGDYWVIDLDPEYRLAAVSDRDREYLWILSRTPKIDDAAYEALLERLAGKGMDVNRLVLTRQD